MKNEQTLCAEHNLIKKNYLQNETGKRFFIKLYEETAQEGDQCVIVFIMTSSTTMIAT